MASTQYERATIKHPNPIVAASHRARLGLANRMISRFLPSGGSVLDFGAGEGALLQAFASERPDAELAAVEPYARIANPALTLFHSLDEVSGKYDVITSFEVLEHLREPDADAFFAFCQRALRPGGTIIISVPIMLGPMILPKALNAVRTRASWRYSWTEMLRAAILLQGPKERGVNGPGYNHRGFDFREIRARVDKDFKVVEERLSPFPGLWWGLNSQWFCVFRP